MIFALTLIVFLFMLPAVISICISTIKCNDGIIIGTDSRSSSSNLILTHEAKHIYKLDDHVYICCSSGKSQFIDLLNELESSILSHKLLNNKSMSIISIVHYARKLVHHRYKSLHLIIISNDMNRLSHDFDSNNHDTCTSSIYEIIPNGSLIEQDYTVIGSSSNILYPLLKELYDNQIDVLNESTNDSTSTITNINSDIDQCSDKSTSKYIQQDIIWCKDDDNNILSQKSQSKQSIKSSTLLSSKYGIKVISRVLKSAHTLDPQSGGKMQLFKLDKYGLQSI